MRGVFQSGPLLLVLGVALTGCNQARNEPSKAPAGTEQPSAATTQQSESDYVLTIEGMH